MAQYYLVYDDACPICLASLEKLRQIDTLGIVVPVPLSAPSLSRRIGMPVDSEMKNALHLFDEQGNVYRGAEAVWKLLALFPKSRWVAQLLKLPGMRWLAHAVYGVVARNRLKLSRIIT